MNAAQVFQLALGAQFGEMGWGTDGAAELFHQIRSAIDETLGRANFGLDRSVCVHRRVLPVEQPFLDDVLIVADRVADQDRRRQVRRAGGAQALDGGD